MPGNILNADIGFPSFSGSSEQQLGEVKNYLYMLLEQLRYSMGNLDAKNFNQAGLNDLAKIITDPVYVVLHDDQKNIAALILEAEQLSSRLTDAEGNISAVQQTAESISVSVSNNRESSSIVLWRDGLQVDTQEIVLTGAIKWADLSESVQSTIYAQAPPGYIKSTYIDATTIKSPTIEANEFNVYQQTESNTGGFNLYGSVFDQENPYHMFSVYYSTTLHNGFPGVRISSPAGAALMFGENSMNSYFYGTVNFSNANATGLESTAVFG